MSRIGGRGRGVVVMGRWGHDWSGCGTLLRWDTIEVGHGSLSRVVMVSWNQK